MKFLSKTTVAAIGATIGLMSGAANAAITVVNNAGSFTSPASVDFSQLAPGPIADPTTFLAALGINSISVDVVTGGADTFNATTSSPGLGAADNGALALVPLNGAIASTSFTFGFSAPTDGVFFEIADILFGGTTRVELFLGGMMIDSVDINENGGLIGVVSTVLFDAIRITELASTAVSPFGIRSITTNLVASAVPLPGAALLFLGGLAGGAAVRRRKAATTKAMS